MEAADIAGIDSKAYAHARLLNLLIVTKMKLRAIQSARRKEIIPEYFLAALCINWARHQYALLKGES
jgi:hypothetical protein